MANQLLLALKKKLEDLSAYGPVDAEVKRNVLKEELQFYVLNFITLHPRYSQWVMYGGSALRICHGLNRMSVDLDFEIPQPCDDVFLQTLSDGLLDHFKNTYAVEPDFLTIKITHRRGLTLKFIVGSALDTGHHSKQVHVKIDLNHFVPKKLVIERIPINHDQLSFVITIYNMSALMASKIAAIFTRKQRGIDQEIYDEKGRDIYDLLWYMEKGIIPDLDYLKEKVPEIADFRIMFDRLTVKMNAVSEKNLRQDLTPLFVEQSFIQNWLASWRVNYQHLLEKYEVQTVTNLSEIVVRQESKTGDVYFTYVFNTAEKKSVMLTCAIERYWLKDREGDLSESDVSIDTKIIALVSSIISVRDIKKLDDRAKRYVTLFYRKIEEYFTKTGRVMLGRDIETKLVRMTADKLNQKEQTMLNKSTLLSCELDDLLK